MALELRLVADLASNNSAQENKSMDADKLFIEIPF